MSGQENRPKAVEDAFKEGIDYVVRDGLRVDAKEFDPRFKNIMKKADEDAEMGVVRRDLFWFDIWRNKKRILKDRYRLQWRSLAELNPNVSFD
jgi:hypothetical protein